MFGYAKVESLEKWQALATTGVCRKWWDCVRDMMRTNSENSPKSIGLREVFHHEC
ncbi:MAG TPA: hypothetical protein DCX06_05470 [Opitutae bacterium]|nr:hypothetical protein [Opitutae bacterium]